MLSQYFFIALCLLAFTTQAVKTLTIEERCALSETGVICNDCLHEYDCTTKAIGDECFTGEVCDRYTSDTGCYRLSPIIAPTCYCNSTGCVGDPTNDAVGMKCGASGDLPTSGPICANDEEINLDTCTCEAFNCPACGFYALDSTSTCPILVAYCADESGFTYECEEGKCYDPDYCGCEDIIPDCPTCGFAPDPAGDAGAFCFCQSSPSVCGLECVSPNVFDPLSCICVTNIFT